MKLPGVTFALLRMTKKRGAVGGFLDDTIGMCRWHVMYPDVHFHVAEK